MLVKDLIKALQACDPETNVDVDLERCDFARMAVVKQCLDKNTTKPLINMDIDGVALEQGLQGEGEYTISCILKVKANA